MHRTIISNTTIVTGERSGGSFHDCDLMIEGDRIAAIQPNLDRQGDAEIIDGRNFVAMPGLINAHLHTWETALRGIGADWRGNEYFEVLLGELGAHFTPDDIYVATLAGALNQLDGGCTTIMDWCHNTLTPDHSDMAIKALEDAGIRAVFGHGTPKPNPSPGRPHFSTVPFPAAEAKRLREGRFASNDEGLLSLALCILGPDYAEIGVNRHDFKLAREYDLMTSAHVWGGKHRKTPGGYRAILDDGLMDPRHNAVHANFIDPDEIKLLVDHGCSVTATPSIEVGVPRAPVIDNVIRAGGRPSIAIDTEVEVSGSMFDCMKGAAQLRGTYASIAAFDQNEERRSSNRPDVDGALSARGLDCTSQDVLEWATINNAHALGLASKTGSLSVGKQADIVLLRANDLNLIPLHDPVESIVVHANQSNVDTVFVSGRAVKRDGRLLFGQLTAEKIRDDLAASSQRLLQVANSLGKPLV